MPAEANFFSSRDAISQFLFLADLPQAVDLCVVLGAPSYTNIDPAISLYHANLVKNIVITGFGPKGMRAADDFVPEYAGLLDRALRAGVPQSAILLEKTATNTLENFVETAKIIEAEFSWNAINSIAIAGKPLHMRRAQMTARKHWPQHVKLVMLPTINSTDLQADTWFRSELGRKRILTELGSIAQYSLKNDIGGSECSSIHPKPCPTMCI